MRCPLLLLALLPSLALCQDQNSAQANAFSITSLTGSQFNLTSGFRIEMRVTNVAATDAARRTFLDWQPTAGGRIRVRIDPTFSYILTESSLEGFTGSTVTNLNGNSDFIIRVDWIRLTILSAARVTMRVSLFTPTGAVIERKIVAPDQATGQSSVDMRGGTLAFGSNVALGEPCQCRIAWARMWSAPGTETTTPSNNLKSGNLYDWEFPTTLVDEVAGYTLTASGAVTYTDTPLAVGLPITSLSFRAGVPFVVDASPIAASSYTWSVGTYQAGLPAPTIRGSGSSITLWNTGQGKYNLTLNVVDSKGRSGNTTIAVGAVVTNPSGVIFHPTATADDNARRLLLGDPIQRKGLTAWDRINWFSPNSYRVTASLYPTFWTQDYETYLAGTVQVTNGSTGVTGTGTAFTTNFLCTGSNDYILVRYTVSGEFVWNPVAVQSCGSATSITLATAWDGPSGSGLAYMRWDDTILTRWTEGINYYDAVKVQYQNWYATGQQTDLDNARRLANDWWRSYLVKSGNSVETISGFRIDPRRASIGGLMLYAIDLDTPTAQGGLGNPTLAARVRKWCHLHTVLAWEIYVRSYLPPARPTSFSFGVREVAYTTNDAAGLALAAPASTGTVNTSGTAVTWVSGDQFNSLQPGNAIIINGVSYTVQGFSSATSITLSTSAGVQAGVAYSFDNKAMWLSELNNVAFTGWWRPWQCHTGNPSPRCSDSWSIGAWRGADPLYGGYADLPWHDSLAHELALWTVRTLLPGFTDTSTLDSVIGDSRSLLKDGVAKTGGGAGPPYIWEGSNGTSGFAGRPCNSYEYWSFATPSSLNTDADGNSTFAPCGSTYDQLRDFNTYSNECLAAAWQWADSGSAADQTRWQQLMGSAWGGLYGPETFGMNGLGMLLPVGTSSWTSTGSYSSVLLKQQGQSRALAACSGLGVRDPVTNTNKTVTYSFVLGAATSLDWATNMGLSGTCLASPCNIQIKARLGGTLFKADWKLAGSTIKTTGWTTIKSPE